jgi:hypothetical protein
MPPKSTPATGCADMLEDNQISATFLCFIQKGFRRSRSLAAMTFGLTFTPCALLPTPPRGGGLWVARNARPSETAHTNAGGD